MRGLSNIVLDISLNRADRDCELTADAAGLASSGLIFGWGTPLVACFFLEDKTSFFALALFVSSAFSGTVMVAMGLLAATLNMRDARNEVRRIRTILEKQED